MRRNLSACLIWLCAIFATTPVIADALDCAPYRFTPSSPAVPEPSADSFLLKIQPSASIKPSYVLASYHATAPDLIETWAPVQALMASLEPRIAVFERDYQSENITPLIRRDTPADFTVIPGLQAALVRRLTGSDLVLTDLSSMAIWYLSISVTPTHSTPKQTQAIDLQLQQLALSQKTPLRALESFADISAIYDRLPDQDQLRLLAEALCNQDILLENLTTQNALYRDNNVEGFYTALTRWQGQDEDLAGKLNQGLVTARNARFTDTLIEEIRKGDAFIVVGNLHVFGESGLLANIQKMMPTTRITPVELQALRFRGSSDDFPELLSWLRHADPRMASEKPVPIQAVAAADMRARLCPNRQCVVDATQSDLGDAIEFTFQSYANLLAGEPYARSLLVREYARHSRLATLRTPTACQRRQSLHEASVLQARWAADNRLDRQIMIFPAAGDCL